jgi:predicted nucleic acid-binding protein
MWALLLIGEIDLLPKLFGSVAVPETVARELRHTRRQTRRGQLHGLRSVDPDALRALQHLRRLRHAE